jgi:hypothetical protein
MRAGPFFTTADEVRAISGVANPTFAPRIWNSTNGMRGRLHARKLVAHGRGRRHAPACNGVQWSTAMVANMAS